VESCLQLWISGLLDDIFQVSGMVEGGQEIALRWGRLIRVVLANGGVRRPRLAHRLLLLLHVLLPLVLEKPEVLVGFLQCVVLPVEGMNHVVLIRVDLVFDFYIIFHELDEFLHFDAEEAVHIEGEFFA